MISILMPIYNGVDFFSESLASVLGQTYQQWQLIVGVNGHGDDESVFVKARNVVHRANNDRRIVVCNYPDVRGKADALNAMLLACSYDYVCLLDVDDLWMPDKLKLQLPYMKFFDVVGTFCQYFGARDGFPNIPLGRIDPKYFEYVNPIVNSSVMIRRTGDLYWDTNLSGLEDYDLWLRMNQQGKSFFNVRQALVRHRIHSQSFFNTQDFGQLEAELKEKWRCA